MDELKPIHLTLRMPLKRRIEFSIACDLQDATMSKKLHRIIAETITAARQYNPDFDRLVKEALKKEIVEDAPPTKIKRKSIKS